METQETPQEKTLSKGQLLVAIFTSPGQAFSSLAAKPNWMLPVIIMLVLSFASGFLVQDITTELTKERIIANEKIPEQMKDQILTDMDAKAGSPMAYVQMLGGILVFVLVPIFFVAAIFLLTGNFVFGGESNYKTMLAVYCWGLMVSIPETIIKIPMMLMNNSIHAYTSLAVLFETSESGTALFKIANSIDIFSLWRVVLWSIGFGITYKFSKGKSYTAIGLLYVIYVVLYVIISGALSKLTGGMI